MSCQVDVAYEAETAIARPAQLCRLVERMVRDGLQQRQPPVTAAVDVRLRITRLVNETHQGTCAIAVAGTVAGDAMDDMFIAAKRSWRSRRSDRFVDRAFIAALWAPWTLLFASELGRCLGRRYGNRWTVRAVRECVADVIEALAARAQRVGASAGR